MIINFLIIIKQKMQSRKNWGLLVLLLILYMGIAVSLNIYYIKSNANTSQYIEIAAVPGSGEVTFRGMLIDSSWYNPQDVIVDSSTWAKIPIFIILLMCYSLDIEGESDGDPVEVILHDKILIGLILIYAICIFSLLYLI